MKLNPNNGTHDLSSLNPHLRGYYWVQNNLLGIPLILCTLPNHGIVSSLLDNLPPNKTILFPNVLSPILQSLLQKRRFQKENALAILPDLSQDSFHVWVKRPPNTKPNGTLWLFDSHSVRETNHDNLPPRRTS